MEMRLLVFQYGLRDAASFMQYQYIAAVVPSQMVQLTKTDEYGCGALMMYVSPVSHLAWHNGSVLISEVVVFCVRIS